jgi:hypothetical protein
MSGKEKIVRPVVSGAAPGERRRRAVVIHDERGNGRVEWVDAPHGLERTTLSVEEIDRERPPERGYDPYAKGAGTPRKPPGGEPRRSRRDLRQLSEWIKQVRRAEALKRAESGESGESGESDPQA